MPSSDPENRRRLAVLFNLIAVAVVVFYGWMIADYYSTYLDDCLHYVPPQVSGAPDDVLGFGFWPTWLMVLFLLLMFELPACLLSMNRRRQLAIVVIPFVIVSVVDFYFAGVLAQQVPT